MTILTVVATKDTKVKGKTFVSGETIAEFSGPGFMTKAFKLAGKHSARILSRSLYETPESAVCVFP